MPPVGVAQPRRCVAPGTLPRSRNPHQPAPVLDHSGAEEVDIRRTVLPRTRPGAEAEEFRQRQGIPFETNEAVRSALRQVLPFHPTKAQKTALGEIVADMRAPEPMRRLLQGDVGSGKTIVALQAMLVAIENGYQAALMAPTEILATQHFLGARKLLERSQQHYKVVLLTGSLDEDRKRANRGMIARGEAQLVIGTHALIEESVDFAKLGLVVVDEQHRFGVCSVSG